MNTIKTKMKNNNAIKSILLLCFVAFGFVSCDNDDDNPAPIDEEEVITTMNVTLMGAGSTITLQSQDLDGDGPNPPEITVSGSLAPNATYNGSIELLNETETPAEDITEEIEEEDEEHQFFFSTSGAITGVDYEDLDSNGNPVGLNFTLNTGDAGSGTLRITLRHEPKKPNDGTLADAGGETDIDQEFTITVE